MVKFTIKLADISFEISALFDKTADFFHNYITDSKPCDTIISTSERLKKEHEFLLKSYRHIYLNSLEATEPHWLYHQLASRLPMHNALLIHGSSVVLDGRAYLFTAPSGTGKSTHVMAWMTRFGKRAKIINDDRTLLKLSGDDIYAYGSPWMGKHRRGSNIHATLQAICFLERAEANSIAEVSALDAFPGLMRECYFIRKGIGNEINAPGTPGELEYTEKMLNILDKLVNMIPLYRLRCNTEPDAVSVAYKGLHTAEMNEDEI